MTRAHRMSHDEANALLPWLANGTLAGGERHEVEAHVRDCIRCRRELDSLATLRRELADPPDVPAPDMRRVNARIDAHRGGPIRRFIAPLLTSPVRVALLAQSIALVALAIILVWPAASPEHYRTLTDVADLPAGAYVRTVFGPDVTRRELERLLADLDLRIAAGPSPRGVYTLRSTDGFALEGERLEELRQRPDVLFAEPLRIGGDLR